MKDFSKIRKISYKTFCSYKDSVETEVYQVNKRYFRIFQRGKFFYAWLFGTISALRFSAPWNYDEVVEYMFDLDEYLTSN